MITIDEFETTSPREAAQRLIGTILNKRSLAQIIKDAQGDPFTGAAQAILAYSCDDGETADPALRSALVNFFRSLLDLPAPILPSPTIETANDSLSRLASEIARILRECNAAYNDIADMGELDCGMIITKVTSQRVREALVRYHQTADSFYSLLVARTDERSVYMSGLDVRSIITRA